MSTPHTLADHAAWLDGRICPDVIRGVDGRWRFMDSADPGTRDLSCWCSPWALLRLAASR